MVRRLAPASALLAAATLVKAGAALAVALLVGRGLGETVFGRWTFCLAWAGGLTMVAEFGLNVLVTRDVARDHRQGGTVIGAALAAKALLLAPIGALFVAAAPVLSVDRETTGALAATVALVAAGAACGTFASALRGLESRAALLAIDTSGAAAGVAGTAWIVGQRLDVIHLIWLATAVQVWQTAAGAAAWSRLSPGPAWRWPSPAHAARLLKHGTPFAGASVLAAMQSRSNPLLLGYLRGPVETGWFGAAARLVDAIKLVPHAVFGAALPVFASEWTADRRRAEDLFARFHRGLSVFALAAAAGIAVGAGPLIALAYGGRFAPATGVLTLLALALPPALLNSSLETYLYATGEEAVAVRVNGIGTAVQLVLAVPLVVSMGSVGAASALLAGEATMWMLLSHHARRRGARPRPAPADPVLP